MKIRRMTPADHDPCIAMMKDFYHSPAVSHALPVAVHERAFQAAVEGEPMMEGLVLEEDGQIAGYAMILYLLLRGGRPGGPPGGALLQGRVPGAGPGAPVLPVGV